MPLKRANIFVSGNVQIVCEGEEEKILKLRTSLKENPPPFSRVEDTEIEFSAFKGEFSTFERKGADIVEESEDTTALLKKMVGYMEIFVDKSEVVNQRLGDIKVTLDEMNDTLKSVKEDTAQIPRIVENTEKILEYTSHIPAMREDISEIKKNTSQIPAMREDVSKIKNNTREIADKVQDEYEELSREIARIR